MAFSFFPTRFIITVMVFHLFLLFSFAFAVGGTEYGSMRYFTAGKCEATIKNMKRENTTNTMKNVGNTRHHYKHNGFLLVPTRFIIITMVFQSIHFFQFSLASTVEGRSWDSLPLASPRHSKIKKKWKKRTHYKHNEKRKKTRNRYKHNGFHCYCNGFRAFPVFPIFMSCNSGRGESMVYGIAYHWPVRDTQRQAKHKKQHKTMKNVRQNKKPL